MTKEQADAHELLRVEALACKQCALATTRTQVVFSRGDPRSRLWLIGEAPGADEDKQGQPFVGRAGQLLDKIMAAAQIEPNEVFITNTVLCRPPGNRVPTDEEIAACAVHRNGLLEIWNPPLVVLLGGTAARVFLRAKTVGELRGKFVEQDGRIYCPTFHPAYLLRDPNKKSLAWKDWQTIRDRFRQIQPEGNDAGSPALALMPYLEGVVNTPQGPGRLVQVFRESSAVVLDRDPSRVTRFPTSTLARLLEQRATG